MPPGPRVRSRERREELLRIAAEHGVHPDIEGTARPAGRNGARAELEPAEPEDD